MAYKLGGEAVEAGGKGGIKRATYKLGGVAVEAGGKSVLQRTDRQTALLLNEATPFSPTHTPGNH